MNGKQFQILKLSCNKINSNKNSQFLSISRRKLTFVVFSCIRPSSIYCHVPQWTWWISLIICQTINPPVHTVYKCTRYSTSVICYSCIMMPRVCLQQSLLFWWTSYIYSIICEISGCYCGVTEIFALLGCYAAYAGSCLLTFQESLNYQHVLCNNPEE